MKVSPVKKEEHLIHLENDEGKKCSYKEKLKQKTKTQTRKQIKQIKQTAGDDNKIIKTGNNNEELGMKWRKKIF